MKSGYLLQLKKSYICKHKKISLPGDLLPLIQCLLGKQLHAREKYIPGLLLDLNKVWTPCAPQDWQRPSHQRMMGYRLPMEQFVLAVLQHPPFRSPLNGQRRVVKFSRGDTSGFPEKEGLKWTVLDMKL